MNSECSCFVCGVLCTSPSSPCILNHKFSCRSLEEKNEKHYFDSDRDKISRITTKIRLCSALISRADFVKEVADNPGKPRNSLNNCVLLGICSDKVSDLSYSGRPVGQALFGCLLLYFQIFSLCLSQLSPPSPAAPSCLSSAFCCSVSVRALLNIFLSDTADFAL